ncbi:MAG TPA: fluoride efflux transporter CrcB [Candidatus Polarisedimenticolaceae bacterium]|jgi:CrcB protein
MRFLWVCFGGFLGTGARYALNGWIAQRYGETFPVGTLAVNVLGSFAIGVIYAATGPDSRWVVSPDVRQFLMIGILGGFTTFSSFSLQTLALLREGEVGAAVANVVLSVVLCLLAAWAGEELVRAVRW